MAVTSSNGKAASTAAPARSRAAVRRTRAGGALQAACTKAIAVGPASSRTLPMRTGKRARK